MRKALILLAAFALTLIAGATPAAADGTGMCSISGVTVNIGVKETPNEGSVKYVSLSSTILLDLNGSDSQSTRATIFYELPDNGTPVMPAHNAYSADVPGDGLYNYRIDFNWDGLGLAHTQVGRVQVIAEKANSQNDCLTNVYI